MHVQNAGKDDVSQEKYERVRKRLGEWGLSQYTHVMCDQGWDDPQYWTEIDDDTLENSLRFKPGHIVAFKDKVKKVQAKTITADFIVKLVLLGDSRVGKSSVVMRFVKNEFDQYKFPTIGATFLSQSVCVGDYEIKYEIWDTAGQEKYRSLAPLYYRGASAALCVYDITNTESFEHVLKWIEEVRTQEGNHVVIAIAGNKVDLAANRKVAGEQGAELAKEDGFIFFETSAKESTNIKEIFRAIGMCHICAMLSL